MFSLFQSIFTRRTTQDSGYPESLVEAAIERAVDGTDPRLRALGGCRKRLRQPVLHAVDHIVRLIDDLPAPVAVNSASYRNDPLLGAMFSSPQRMLEVLANDRNIDAARRAANTHHIVALLVAKKSEKHTLGVDQEDGVMKRDVRQTIVSFDEHRLVDPFTDASETMRALKRRAFDHLLAQVLAGIGKRRDSRRELGGQRALLKRKLSTLKAAGWSFDKVDAATPDVAALERRLEEIEAGINAIGADSGTLETHLQMLTEALASAERQLWIEQRSLILDHRNVLRSRPDSNARPMCLQQLRDAQGALAVVVLLEIDPGLLPGKTDFFSAANSYL